MVSQRDRPAKIKAKGKAMTKASRQMNKQMYGETDEQMDKQANIHGRWLVSQRDRMTKRVDVQADG
jgi:hypothetical protein